MKKEIPSAVKTGTNRREDTNVIVQFPDEISIELVQANDLRQYELFQWLIALVASIAVGFWTAYVSDPHRALSLLWSAGVFSVMTLVFFLFAIRFREKMYHGSVTKSVSLKDFE